MNNLVVIVNANVIRTVTDRLRELEIPGFTLTHVEGHGRRTAEDRFLSARDRVEGFVPRVRVDIVLPDEQVTKVLDALRDGSIGLAGHGIYWVSPVDRLGRF